MSIFKMDENKSNARESNLDKLPNVINTIKSIIDSINNINVSDDINNKLDIIKIIQPELSDIVKFAAKINTANVDLANFKNGDANGRLNIIIGGYASVLADVYKIFDTGDGLMNIDDEFNDNLKYMSKSINNVNSLIKDICSIKIVENIGSKKSPVMREIDVNDVIKEIDNSRKLIKAYTEFLKYIYDSEIYDVYDKLYDVSDIPDILSDITKQIVSIKIDMETSDFEYKDGKLIYKPLDNIKIIISMFVELLNDINNYNKHISDINNITDILIDTSDDLFRFLLNVNDISNNIDITKIQKTIFNISSIPGLFSEQINNQRIDNIPDITNTYNDIISYISNTSNLAQHIIDFNDLISDLPDENNLNKSISSIVNIMNKVLTISSNNITIPDNINNLSELDKYISNIKNTLDIITSIVDIAKKNKIKEKDFELIKNNINLISENIKNINIDGAISEQTNTMSDYFVDIKTLLKSIISIFEDVNTLKKNKINTKYIDSIITNVILINNKFNEINIDNSDVKNIDNLKKYIISIKSVVNDLLDLFKSLYLISKLKIDDKIIDKIINNVNILIIRVSNISIEKDTQNKIKDLSVIINDIKYLMVNIIILELLAIPAFVMLPLLRFVITVINWTSKIIRRLKRIRNINTIKKSIENINDIINSIKSLLINIILIGPLAVLSIPGTLLLSVAIIQVIFICKLIDFLIKSISISRKTRRKLNNLIAILNNLTLVLVTLVLMIPIMAAFIMVSPIIIICFALIYIVLRIITFVLSKSINAKTLIILLLISGLLVVLLAFAGILLLISLISIVLVNNVLYLLGFFVMLITIITLMGLLGFALIPIIPILIPTMIGLAFVGMLLFALLFISSMLYIIQIIDLDINVIKNNIDTIIKSCLYIIESIFTNSVDTGEGSESWMGSFLSGVFGFGGVMIKALMAASFLATSIIAIGLITLLSIQLKIIEFLELNPTKVSDNVNTVINTCLMIIDSIFNREDNDSKPSNKNWLASIFRYIGSGLADIIGSIMAIGFLATSLVAISLITLLATELKYLEILNLDSAKVQESVTTVINTCLSVIDSIFNREDKDSKPSNKNWLASIFRYIGSGLADIIGSIMAIGFLATSLVAISLITLLATELKYLEILNLDSTKVQESVTTVINTCLSVIDSIFNREDEDTNPSNKNWIISIFEYVGGGLANIIGSIMAVGFLATSLVAISLITLLAKQLKTIQDIDIDSNIITGKITIILKTSTTVLNALKTDMGDILGAENTKRTSLISWMFPKLADLASILSSIGLLSLALVAVGSLAQIATNLKTIQETGDLSGVDKKTTMILNVATKVINTMKKNIEDVDIDADEVIEKMAAADKMADIVTKFIKLDDKYVNNSTKATDNFVKFIDKINTTDLSKLNATAKLFQNMSKFSESIRGNFEGLADALNEKIAPLLEELKDLLTDIPNTINTSSDKISQTVVNNSSKENITPEKARKNAELFGAPGTKENEKVVKQQMVEKEEKNREKRRIEDILMDIKDILNGAGAYTAGVKTR